MRVSIMITTSNRLDELQRTLQILAKLDPAPDEILITADGCIDGTAEFVSAVPKVKCIVNQPAKGSVASRDGMMRKAQGDLVLALDDDSYPEQADCIARIISFFEQRPKLAVLHFPQRTNEYPETLAQANRAAEHLTRSFANSGAVLRRSTSYCYHPSSLLRSGA
jgi:glycosyltransferase involved in cell wall biosynthesis